MAPVTSLVQTVLFKASTVDEALKIIRDSKRGGSAILMVADRDRAVSIELLPNHIGVREAENGRIAHTNHYHTEHMRKIDISHNAYYKHSRKVVRALRGRRVRESSEARYSRIMQLLAQGGELELSDLISIARDHAGGEGADNTVCRHSEYFNTTWSIIFIPSEKVIKALVGYPCQQEYEEYRVG